MFVLDCFFIVAGEGGFQGCVDVEARRLRLKASARSVELRWRLRGFHVWSFFDFIGVDFRAVGGSTPECCLEQWGSL